MRQKIAGYFLIDDDDEEVEFNENQKWMTANRDKLMEHINRSDYCAGCKHFGLCAHHAKKSDL